jgi:hypothetical protein
MTALSAADQTALSAADQTALSAADQTALQARLEAILDPYRDRLELATIYNIPTLRRRGANAHQWFAFVKPASRHVGFFLLPVATWPELREGVSPALARRRPPGTFPRHRSCPTASRPCGSRSSRPTVGRWSSSGCGSTCREHRMPGSRHARTPDGTVIQITTRGPVDVARVRVSEYQWRETP